MNREELHWITARRKFDLLANCNNLTTKELSKKIKMSKTDVRFVMMKLIEKGLATKTKHESEFWDGKVNLYNLTQKGEKYLNQLKVLMDDNDESNC